MYDGFFFNLYPLISVSSSFESIEGNLYDVHDQAAHEKEAEQHGGKPEAMVVHQESSHGGSNESSEVECC